MRMLNKAVDRTPRHEAAEQITRLIQAHGYRRGDKLPTYRTLAERLGVSLVTVQRAMDDLAAAGIVHRLRSKGTFVLKELSTGPRRLGEVGLLFFGSRTQLIESPYRREILAGIVSRCERIHADLQMLSLSDAQGGRVDPHRFVEKADGVILLGVTNRDYIREFAAENIPVVAADYFAKEPPLDYVACDNRAATRAVTSHLLDSGHRRVLYVDFGVIDPLGAGPARPFEPSPDSRERRAAFLATMKAAGAADTAAVIGVTETGSTKAMLETVLRALRAPGGPTALVAFDAFVAGLLMEALHGAGLSVPSDVSLAAAAGAAGEDLCAGVPLTYSRLDFRGMGRLSMELLERRCQSARPKKATTKRVGFDLIFGATVATADGVDRPGARLSKE